MKSTISILASLFILAACGGGEGSAPAAPAAQPVVAPAPVAPAIRIEVYGDSTTYGVGAASGQSEPDHIRALLGQVYPGKKFEVVNRGVDGANARQRLYGTDGNYAQWDLLMASSKADIVIINFGMNDTVAYSIGDYSAYIAALVNIARQNGKRVVLEEPNPTCHADRAALINYVRTLDAVAAALQVPIVSQYWRMLTRLGVSQPTCTDLAPYEPDGMHPNGDMYRWKAVNTVSQMEVTGVVP